MDNFTCVVFLALLIVLYRWKKDLSYWLTLRRILSNFILYYVPFCKTQRFGEAGRYFCLSFQYIFLSLLKRQKLRVVCGLHSFYFVLFQRLSVIVWSAFHVEQLTNPGYVIFPFHCIKNFPLFSSVQERRSNWGFKGAFISLLLVGWSFEMKDKGFLRPIDSFCFNVHKGTQCI